MFATSLWAVAVAGVASPRATTPVLAVAAVVVRAESVLALLELTSKPTQLLWAREAPVEWGAVLPGKTVVTHRSQASLQPAVEVAGPWDSLPAEWAVQEVVAGWTPAVAVERQGRVMLAAPGRVARQPLVRLVVAVAPDLLVRTAMKMPEAPVVLVYRTIFLGQPYFTPEEVVAGASFRVVPGGVVVRVAPVVGGMLLAVGAPVKARLPTRVVVAVVPVGQQRPPPDTMVARVVVASSYCVTRRLPARSILEPVVIGPTLPLGVAQGVVAVRPEQSLIRQPMW